MGMHTDMRPTRAGQIAASRGDVIGVSVGADMLFWYGKSVGAKVAKERHGVLLHDGDTWVWKHEDDMKHKHARPSRPHPCNARRVPGPRGFRAALGALDPDPAPLPSPPSLLHLLAPGMACGFRRSSRAASAMGCATPSCSDGRIGARAPSTSTTRTGCR